MCFFLFSGFESREEYRKKALSQFEHTFKSKFRFPSDGIAGVANPKKATLFHQVQHRHRPPIDAAIATNDAWLQQKLVLLQLGCEGISTTRSQVVSFS